MLNQSYVDLWKDRRKISLERLSSLHLHHLFTLHMPLTMKWIWQLVYRLQWCLIRTCKWWHRCKHRGTWLSKCRCNALLIWIQSGHRRWGINKCIHRWWCNNNRCMINNTNRRCKLLMVGSMIQCSLPLLTLRMVSTLHSLTIWTHQWDRYLVQQMTSKKSYSWVMLDKDQLLIPTALNRNLRHLLTIMILIKFLNQ